MRCTSGAGGGARKDREVLRLNRPSLSFPIGFSDYHSANSVTIPQHASASLVIVQRLSCPTHDSLRVRGVVVLHQIHTAARFIPKSESSRKDAHCDGVDAYHAWAFERRNGGVTEEPQNGWVAPLGGVKEDCAAGGVHDEGAGVEVLAHLLHQAVC